MKARRVVVVVWAGGVRASDTILDPQRRYIPRIGNELTLRGTLLTRLYNDGWTNHGPSLQALATGRWEVARYDDPRPAVDRTLINFARRHGRSTLVVGPEGNRLLLLTGGDPSDVVQASLTRGPAPFTPEEPAAALYKLQSFDRPVATAFFKREATWPDLSFLVFDDTDMAHQGRWSWYVGAVRQADELTWRLWQRLEAEGQTDLLVLPALGRAEHGQTRWGFMGHGREDEGCSRVWMLALGPDFAAGRIVEKRAQLIDVAPTIAWILGFSFPSAGRVLREAFA